MEIGGGGGSGGFCVGVGKICASNALLMATIVDMLAPLPPWEHPCCQLPTLLLRRQVDL